LTEQTDFFDLPQQLRDLLIVQSSKASEVIAWKEGFSGAIAVLDNGQGVAPRRIAAKVPKPKATIDADETAIRFVRELRLQAKAYYHPNVHWPFEFDIVMGRPVAYFRMWEGDLADYVDHPGLGDEGRLTILVHVIEGLRHLYSRGICHQDLKPENIFVRDLRAWFPDLPEDGLHFIPLIADFGSVNLAAEKGIYRGTPPYMAPEQWQERPLSEKTSVFAVGLMLHELLSRGDHPIGQSVSEWRRGSNSLRKAWRRDSHWTAWIDRGCNIVRPIADAALASLVERCLRPDPNDRPTLEGVQLQLRATLRANSAMAAARVDDFLIRAKVDSEAAHWPRLLQRMDWLEGAVSLR
jgi:serine/threonine protein kinase